MSDKNGTKGPGLLRKGDLLIFTAALLLFAVSAFLLWTGGARTADTVTISVDGAVYGVYPLSADRIIELAHNTVVIENGGVYMRDADCPDKLCIRQGKLTGTGLIVCLPNRVVVRVDAGDAGYDAVVGQLREGM